ncbi:MAG: glutamate--tRNA ligase [Gammaproteobacteria bacterium]
MKVRTRFAPSPTGDLHLGGVRTALYSWLQARKHGGGFILRIEDTDQERSTEASIKAILEAMSWLRLDYDQGPIFQTQRFDRYREVIARLLAEGNAYYCTCSKERLEKLREKQLAHKEKPRYDGQCRNRRGNRARPSVSSVIRFASPLHGEVVVDDLVHGPTLFRNQELDDLIIARSDGVPTYNLTVVVDDMDMAISHVIRGDDHLNNTPRQINILRALGADPPRYVHLPAIRGPDGKRLSKRQGAVNVLEYRKQGYLPEAMLNYLVRLGWSHGDQEIFSLQEMVALFDVCDVNKAAARLNPQKLLWLNQHYLKSLAPERIQNDLHPFLEEKGITLTPSPPLEEIIELQRGRSKTLQELAENCRFFYQDLAHYDEQAARKFLRQEAIEPLRTLHERLSLLPEWSARSIHDSITEVAENFGITLGAIAQPLRVALSGVTVSPPIDSTVELIGRERSLERLDRALRYIQQQRAP